jgi:hypothetical protein
MPWKDLRREERCRFSAPVLLMWQQDGQTFEVKAKAVNRSANGLAVEAYHPMPVRSGQLACAIPSLGALSWVQVRHGARRGLKFVAGLEFDQPLRVH